MVNKEFIPNGWRKVTIDDICELRRGASPRPISDPKYFGNGAGWVRISDVTRAGNYLKQTEQYLSKLGESKSVKVTPGEVIMSICATIGRPIIVDMEACIHDGFVVFKNLSEHVNNLFFLYWLKTKENYFNSLGQQGTQKNLNTNIVKKTEILLPPLPVQRKIAAILSSVDEAIEKTEAIIEQTEKVKKGLMQQLLTKGIGHTKFKKTEIGEIPEKWEVVKINDIFERVTRNNDLKDSYPILTISAKEGFVDQKERFNRVIAGRSLEKYILLHKGEFAYNRGNSKSYPFGVIYKLNDFEKGLVPFVYFCFRKKSNIEFNLDFYQYYFLSHKLDRQLRKIITSSARQDGLMNISADDFFNLLIPFPPKSEQEEIVKYIQSVDKRIKKEREKFETLILVKKGLMQSLLTGKVRVKVNEDEVVSS